MVRVESASVIKSGRKVLTGFSFTIADNEHWVIRGPNGSGKTLLLELIAGIITPAEGQVSYSFIDATEWSARYAQRRKYIHYVPALAMQNFLAGHHDVFYQQRYYDIGEPTIPKVRDILGLQPYELEPFRFPTGFDIQHLLDLEVTSLSNGQLRKVVLLKGLAGSVPKLLLLDYPFEGLDDASRKDLCVFIDHLATAHDVRIIIVDHDHNLPRCIGRSLTIHQDGTATAADFVPDNPKPFNVQPVIESASPPVVELRNVSIRYGPKSVLSNLNWVIRRGERWALTGKNGCGKTTLFSLIYADHPMAYTQEIYLFGRRRGTGESIWDIKNRIAYVGPERLHYLSPRAISMSCREYIGTCERTVNQQKLAILIDVFRAGTFIDTPVRSLSSGDLQCLLLILAFLSEKELLLLDEPFQFLDRDRTDRLNKYLDDFLGKSTTLILITHNEAEIRRWTQRRMML